MTSTPPIASTIQALASQVGGHAGVMTTEDGSLLIKPALPRELAFYQRIQVDTDPAFVKLRDYTPKFLGTLTLEGETTQGDAPGEELKVQPIGNRTESLVLENLSYRFTRPNILDIKLGRVLYDETASEDKVQRMIKTAHETTSWETGIRLTGFQVHDNYTKQPVNTPKSYGKSIKPSDLPDGIARFFPAAEPKTRGNADADETTPSEESRLGLPPQTLLPILSSIRSEIAEIRKALANIEMRMVGGSLLIIYEADWDRAQEGINRYLEEASKPAPSGESGGDGEEDDLEDAEGEEEDDDEDDEEEEAQNPPPFRVKLIDFAHTRVEAGLGPDEGVLLGVDTVLNLLDGRIKEVKETYNLYFE